MSEHVSEATLFLHRFNFEDQISGRDELSFDPSACSFVTDRNGKMDLMNGGAWTSSQTP